MEATLRATIAGLFVGSLIMLANFQFGLQTGWVSMMSLPAALLSYGIIKSIPSSIPFTPQENVYAQSVAVAVATGPLAFGFIGIIPAIEKLMTHEESGFHENWVPFAPSWKLIVWSIGLAFFGVFFAVPLRQEFIVKQKLKFPSGKATAMLIGVFHNSPVYNNDDDEGVKQSKANSNNNKASDQTLLDSNEDTHLITNSSVNDVPLPNSNNEQVYSRNINILMKTTLVSSLYTLSSYFVPQIKTINIFGSYLSKNYLLNFTPSPAYIGQGIIMGIETTTGMMIGMIIGWCILGPIAKAKGWAPGVADDWKDGIAGWTMWIALGIMIVDSLVSLGAMVVKLIFSFLEESKKEKEQNQQGEAFMLLNQDHDASSYDSINVINNSDDSNSDKMNVPSWVPALGLIVSTPFLLGSMHILFGQVVPSLILLVMIPLSLILSILGVKALGETDLNPVSGIGKLSQLITALILPKDAPGAILTNLICGALAEATTQQAGDLMQDLKTGYMHRASPRAQFVAQLIGSMWSVFLSMPIWLWYNKVYQIPGNEFKIPTAVIWIDCARLVNGQGLPPMAGVFTLIASIIVASIALFKVYITEYVKNETELLAELKKNETVDKVFIESKECAISKVRKWSKWIPSGVAIGIGIYNTSSFTLARFLGGIISVVWSHYYDSGDEINLIVFSSGLVLGEGVTSVLNMALSTWGVPHL